MYIWQQQQSLFVLMPFSCDILQKNKVKIKLEYWLLEITKSASGARQLTSTLKENKFQVSKIAKKKNNTRDLHKDRETNVINITTAIYYPIREV